MTQPLKQHALRSALVDDRKQLVLDVRAATANLVENDGFRAPDGRRRPDVLERTILAGQRESTTLE